ncbi:MAG: PEP-CTERM sorting domain-containing protein [Gammaproteobacteria bacterium]|nr:PEP-CTERM sorting domain-containing protein [Gammaproteobacteria bacterium]
MNKIFAGLAVAIGIMGAAAPNANAYTTVSGTFTDPAAMTFGSYMSGAEGYGYTPPTSYSWTGACNSGSGSCYQNNGNGRDWYWIQDYSGRFAAPSAGLIYDLGGQANQVVVFPLIDHVADTGQMAGQVGPEAWEYNVYLSNDLSTWDRATLDTIYTDGWSPGADISDGYTTVWKLASGQTRRYVSITSGNDGWNADHTVFDINLYYPSDDNEIDAVAGLTERGTGVSTAEPSTLLLFGSAGLAGLLMSRRRVGA